MRGACCSAAHAMPAFPRRSAITPFAQGGLTAYLDNNGGSLENAQAMAAHESPRTTRLYDRTDD